METTGTSGNMDGGWARRFTTFWTSQAASLVGSQVLQFALVWWLARTTGSATLLALAALASLLPMTLLGPLLGTLVDRTDRKRLIMLADLSSAAVAAALALLLAAGRATPALVVVALFVRGVAGAAHQTASTAVTVGLVPAEQLTRVQGKNHALHALLGLGAPLLAALALAHLPLATVVAVDVVTALIAVALLMPLPVPKSRPDTVGPPPRFSAELVEGFRYVRGRRGLLVLVGLAAIINAALVPAFSLLPLLVTDVLGGSAMDLGWLTSIFAVGSLAGGIVLAAARRVERPIATALSAMVVLGVASAALGAASPGRWPLAFAAMAVVGLAGPLANGPIVAVVQATVAPQLLGRVVAVLGSACTAAAPLGLVAAGPLADLFGVRAWFLLGGAVTALAATAAFAVPALRRLEAASQATPTADAPLQRTA